MRWRPSVTSTKLPMRLLRTAGAPMLRSGYEQWLFISGQEEYKNPFTGKTELGTSQYRYRWVNNQGDILYSDENSFDPNKYEEYKTREWKPSPVRPR